MKIQEATQKINELFPNRYIRIVEQNLIGSVCLAVEFANGDASTASNNILMNHSAHMRFLSQPADDTLRGPQALNHPQELELLTWHYSLRKAGLKFRKINAKNSEEALDKLVKWFTKNQDLILQCSAL